MNAHDEPNSYYDRTIGGRQPLATDPPVGDQNVERLLTVAYSPEAPDSGFVARVRSQMHAAADEHRLKLGPLADRSLNVAGESASPTTDGAPPLWKLVVGWAAAAAVLFVLFSITNRGPHVAARRDGAASTTQGVTARLPGQHIARPAAATIERLVARPRAAAPKPTRIAPGDTVVTRRGERRRAELPDGSVLYVNQNTKVAFDSPRHLTLAAGQVYVEVSPRQPDAQVSVGIDARAKTSDLFIDPATFVVQTPDRRVAALGTRFAVRAGASGSDVLVTQGKVHVNGASRLVEAGQQLAFTADRPVADPVPAQRATHALDWTRDLMAAAQSPLVPASKFAGGALVAVDPRGQEAQITLRKYHIDVHIEDGFARTTIDQTYFNETPSRLEGTFYFPLPPDASISRLAMYVSENLMEGGMAERDYARQVFESIKYRMQDPALLEWLDGSTFKMRVFPLEGREEKRIVLGYTQRLETVYGMTKYRFPAGHSMKELGKWSAKVHVHGGEKFAWTCDSHTLGERRGGGHLDLSADGKSAQARRDLALELVDPDAAARPTDVARFSSARHEGHRYLMVRYQPALPLAAERERRDWVILFESSADRDPLLAHVEVEIVKTLLENIEHDDTFTILTAATRTQLLSPQPLAATPDNVRQAVASLERTHLVGALDLEQALSVAEPVLAGAANPHLVHIGSGVPVLGERREDVLAKRIAERAKYVGIGVGKRWSRSLMKQAAARTGGYFTQINPDEDVTWRTLDLVATLNAPRLLDVEVTDDAGRKLLAFTDHVGHGQEVCALQRLDAKDALPKTLTIAGRLNGEAYKQSVAVEKVAERADYLPRMWAKLEIDRLLAADAAKHKDQIVALSKAMYVMSPYTSLLVLENEQMYEQYKVDRGRKDHWAMYPCPAKIKVVREPLGVPAGPAPAATAPAETKPADAAPAKPSPERVLDTILVRIRPPMLLPPGGQDYGPTVYTAHTVLTGAYGVPIPPAVVWFDDGTVADAAAPQNRRLAELMDTDGDRLGIVRSAFNTVIVRGNPRDAQQVMELVRQLDREQLGQGIEGERAAVRFSIRPRAWDSGSIATLDPQGRRSMMRRGLAGWGLSQRNFEGWGLEAADYSLPQVYFPSNEFWKSRSKPFKLDVPPDYEPTEIDLTQELPNAREAQEAKYYDFLGVQLEGRMLYENGVLGRGRTSGLSSWPRFAGNGALYDSVDAVLERRRAVEDGFAELVLADAIIDVGAPRQRHKLHFSAIPDGGDVTAFSIPSLAPSTTYDRFPEVSTWRDIISDRTALRADGTAPTWGWRYDPNRPSLAIADAIINEKQLSLVESLARRRIMPQESFGEYKLRLGSRLGYDSGGMRWGAAADYDANLSKSFPVRYGLNYAVPMNAMGAMAGEQIVLGRQLWERQSVGDFGYLDLGDFWPGGIRPSAGGPPNLLAERPTVSDGSRMFTDLLAYAPGMNTTYADVLAVLEAEADLGPAAPLGKIDPAARKRIDAARAVGWQVVTLPASHREEALEIHFDGAGRYFYQRRTPEGLEEKVSCDGRTLLHLYPELGVGARRPASRFHRAELARLIPWLLPPVEELARGSDVAAIDERTVAIAPSGVERAKTKDGKPVRYVAIHLAFAADGRLAERRVVVMPERKTLLATTFAADGAIKRVGGKGKPLAEGKLAIRGIGSAGGDSAAHEKIAAARLAPDVKQFVVLPMPWRKSDHVYRARGMNLKGPVARYSEDDALAYIASHVAHFETGALWELIGQRFFAPQDKVPGRTTPADRRLGFYTLLMSAGANWSAAGDVVVGSVGEQSRMVSVSIPANPIVDHPGSPLAKYIVEQLYIQQHGKPPAESTATADATAGRPRNRRTTPGLVGTLTDFSKLVREFRSGTNDSELARRSVDFARRTRSAPMAWTALTLLQNRGGGDDKQRMAMAQAYRQWQSTPGLQFAARYEEARQYRLAGNHDKARELFAKLHADAVKHHALIPLDDDFRQAFIQSNNGQQAWEKLWQDHAQSLVARHARRAAVMVAWQCRQLNDARLSDKLLDLALSGMSKEEQYGTSLAAVEMLWHSGVFERADVLIEPLLADERYARSPWLWRIGSQIADRRGRTASCVARLERAMDIEYRHIPEKYNVEAVREQYAQLMQKYQKLVDAIASLEQTPSPTLVASVVRAADRWRRLDTDPTAASQAAAKALYAVGAGDLAWDYVTTPLADKPNEASPWQATAAWLAEQGNVEMADRAYRRAFEAEATNAQILWDHAKMLERGGRFADAQKLFQRIADSEWQPRFAGLKGQALEILKRAKVAK